MPSGMPELSRVAQELATQGQASQAVTPIHGRIMSDAPPRFTQALPRSDMRA
jgi:hypothetical protein